MKTITFLLLAGSVPVTVLGRDPPSAKAAAIDVPAPESRLRAGISFAPLLNARAGFSNLGAFASHSLWVAGRITNMKTATFAWTPAAIWPQIMQCRRFCETKLPEMPREMPLRPLVPAV